VLAQHSDPNLILPETAANEQGEASSRYKVFFNRDGSVKPEYMVWDAELISALADRQFALNGICILSEMSQVLLGLKEGAAPDAARKLRLEATNSLAKAQRKAATWKPAIRRAVTVAQDLESSVLGTRYERKPIGVQTRDGLPIDELDEATIISTLTGGKPTMSVKRGVERQLPDQGAAKDELAELQKDAQNATPSILLGGEAQQTEVPAPSGSGGQEQTKQEEPAMRAA
jgi:hypothetical protein